MMGCILGAFLTPVVANFPIWLNSTVIGIFVVAGVVFLFWRRYRFIITIKRPIDHPIESRHTEESKAQSTEERESKSESEWEINEDGFRKVHILTGEGPSILVGFARTAVTGDPTCNELYYCVFIDLQAGGGRYEFRVHPPSESVIERLCTVSVNPGDVELFRRSWSAANEPLNNILCTSDDVLPDSINLLNSSNEIVFVWTDTIERPHYQSEKQTHRIVVSTTGFREVTDRLSNQAMNLGDHDAFI